MLPARVTWRLGADDAGAVASAGRDPVVKGLAEKANEVAEVGVKSATGVLTLKRAQGGGWQAVEKGNYRSRLRRSSR